MTVYFHSEAEGELRDAIAWYERQRNGLGLEFAFCIDEAVARIRRSPETYPKVHREVRRLVVRRFPFAVFYEIAKTEIRVLAVFHSRRNPKQWQTRK